MKYLKSIFHFLGGIHLAITLIAIAAIMVIAGTWIESKTGSHLLAARWTYENPFFLFLLSLFFINILVSALRRWPFKKRHIPFLMTHLGLLMMISGTMVKNRFGLQGQLRVWEGSGSQHVLQPHTYALLFEEKEKPLSQNSIIALDSFHPNIYSPFHSPQVKFKLIGYAPHVKEVLETWIKDSKAYIAGFPTIPVLDWDPSKPFPQPILHRFSLSTQGSPWSVIALRTSYLDEALQQAYLQGLMLHLRTKEDASQLLNIPLQQALQSSFDFDHGNLRTALHLSFLEKQTIPVIHFTWSAQEKKREAKRRGGTSRQ